MEFFRISEWHSCLAVCWGEAGILKPYDVSDCGYEIFFPFCLLPRAICLLPYLSDIHP